PGRKNARRGNDRRRRTSYAWARRVARQLAAPDAATPCSRCDRKTNSTGQTLRSRCRSRLILDRVSAQEPSRLFERGMPLGPRHRPDWIVCNRGSAKDPIRGHAAQQRQTALQVGLVPILKRDRLPPASAREYGVTHEQI